MAGDRLQQGEHETNLDALGERVGRQRNPGRYRHRESEPDGFGMNRVGHASEYLGFQAREPRPHHS